MKSKIVTAYWMDVNGYPFQGSSNVRKPRYIGSLIAHCKNINLQSNSGITNSLGPSKFVRYNRGLLKPGRLFTLGSCYRGAQYQV
jgi:hypothetical protein